MDPKTEDLGKRLLNAETVYTDSFSKELQYCKYFQDMFSRYCRITMFGLRMILHTIVVEENPLEAYAFYSAVTAAYGNSAFMNRDHEKIKLKVKETCEKLNVQSPVVQTLEADPEDMQDPEEPKCRLVSLWKGFIDGIIVGTGGKNPDIQSDAGWIFGFKDGLYVGFYVNNHLNR